MNTYRILTSAPSLAVLLPACVLFSGCRKPAGEKPQEMWHTNTVNVWHTNTVEKWRTNTVEKWRTNTVEVARTNTVLQPVTNEVIREVPAKLSEVERRAAAVGYKYLNAPTPTDAAGALYKASPLAVEVSLEQSAKRLLPGTSDFMKQEIEGVLRSRNIPLAEKSPYRLRLNMAALWETDVPRVALLRYRLELTEAAVLERQNDIIKDAASVWSLSTSQLARTVNLPEEVKTSLQDQLRQFCNDYLKARENEKAIESRLPAIPSDFASSRQ